MRAEYGAMRWTCAECRHVNPPAQLYCGECRKRRWEHLGIGRAEASEIVDVVVEELGVPEGEPT